MQKFPHFLHLTEISAILAYFCPNLVAMATPLAPLKFLLLYLNSATPKTLLVMQKLTRFLDRTEISIILAYFCPNLVAMATPLAPLKFLLPYLNSPTPKSLLFMRKIPRFLAQN